MAVIDLQFACEHPWQAVDVDKVPQPACLQCGETRVVNTTAPPPRITGCASGPHVTTKALDAIPIVVGTGTVN